MSTIYVDSEVLAKIENRFFDAIPYKYEIRRVRKSTLIRALDITQRAREEYRAKGGVEGMYMVMTSHINALKRRIGV